MPHYFPNQLRELRGTTSLHVLSKKCKLGVGRLRLLEEQGLPSEVPWASLEALAQELQVSLADLFPTLPEKPPAPPPLPFVSELIQEQTTPQEAPPRGPRQRKVRLLAPVLNDGAWEIALDAKVSSRMVFQDLLASAEEMGGWKSIARHSFLVRGDRRYHRTILVFSEEEAAAKFHAEWVDRPYTPDPPNPIVEIHHRHAPSSTGVSSALPIEIADDVEETPPVSSPEPPEELAPPKDEDDDDLLVLEARLSPKILEYYRELRKLYGRGLQKAILIRGITAMAAEFDL